MAGFNPRRVNDDGTQYMPVMSCSTEYLCRRGWKTLLPEGICGDETVSMEKAGKMELSLN